MIVPPGRTPQHRRPLIIVAVLAVAVLLAGELAARALEGRLPDPLVWHTEAAQAKVEQMEALGHAEVVAVGSSLVAHGVDPAVLADRLDVSAYNAGLTAGLPGLTRPWTSQVVIPRLAPELLVVGVGSFDLTDHPSGAVFRDAFVDSPAGRRVTRSSDLLGDASWWLADHSTLWAHRTRLRQPRTLLSALRGEPAEVDPDVAALGPRGRTARYEDLVFDPHEPAGPGLPVGSWSLGTDQPAALRGLVTDAREAGVEILLVTMPTTDAFVDRHPRGEADHATYVEAVQWLATDTGARLLRFDDLRDPELFIDQVHLNRDGASVFSQRLADALAEVRTGSR